MSITRIEYRFGDSSVPPPYHRSYTISLTPDAIKVVVDSYGEVTAQQEKPVDQASFDLMVAALEKHGIGHRVAAKDELGCSGGTTESIAFWKGEEEAFSASVYHCGGDDFGELDGDSRGFAKDLKMLIPDLSALLKK